MSRSAVSRRFYRCLLRCYPAALRERHAAEMEEALMASVEIVAQRRAFGRVYAWVAAVRDLFGAWSRQAASRRSGPAGGKPPRRGDGWVATVFADAAFAVRTLGRNRGFTAVAVLTLALSIGANTALFTVIDAVLLQPLPYKRAADLVAINTTLRDNTWWSASPAEIRAWRRANQVFEEIAFAQRANMTLVDTTEPVELLGARVSHNVFRTLGVAPLLGRDFSPGEGAPGGADVVIIGHGLWRRQFGADPDLVGATLKIDGVQRQLIGVLPPDARLAFYGDQELYVPVQFSEGTWRDRGKNQMTVARLRHGVLLSQAQADMDRVALQMEQDDPQPTQGWGVHLVSLHEQVVGPVRAVLLLLFGAVGFVLLIACANTCNLMLARATARRREFAVRLALGAGRARVWRQLITETCIVAGLGGAGGLLLALWGPRALLSLAPGSLPLQPDLSADARTLGFTLLASLIAGFLLGALPAHRAAMSDPGIELRAAARATGGSGLLRLRSLLITAEVAVVLVLLIGAGLTLRSFTALLDVDPGFAVERRLAVRITLPQALYPTPDEATAFFEELDERVGALPGVVSAGTVSSLPFSTEAGFTSFHILDDRPFPGAGDEPLGGAESVSPGYFETMGIPLLRGRLFEPADDRADGPPVALINEAMWRLHWPDGADPLGTKVLFAPPGAPPPFSVRRQIVGVVRGVKYGLRTDVRPRVYTPSSQLPFAAASRFVVIATSFDRPETLVPAVRDAVRQVDPDQSVALARTLEDWRAASVDRDRFQTVLLGLFGAVALLLGAAGVYGVVSYSVSQRRREAGIRMALGASGEAVLGWVLRGALAPVLAGILIGLAGAIALASVMADLVFEIDARDPLTFALVPLLLVAVALVASIAPAWRASSVDPVESLRAN